MHSGMQAYEEMTRQIAGLNPFKVGGREYTGPEVMEYLKLNPTDLATAAAELPGQVAFWGAMVASATAAYARADRDKRIDRDTWITGKLAEGSKLAEWKAQAEFRTTDKYKAASDRVLQAEYAWNCAGAIHSALVQKSHMVNALTTMGVQERNSFYAGQQSTPPPMQAAPAPPPPPAAPAGRPSFMGAPPAIPPPPPPPGAASSDDDIPF